METKLEQARRIIHSSPTAKEERPLTPWQRQIYQIIFEADTPAGKVFDIALFMAIICSVVVVMLDSVNSVRAAHGELLYKLEWLFTVLFSAEYLLRLASVRRPLRYASSFFGVVDLLAILPTYLSLIVSGTQALLIVRIFRLLRVFRVFKLTRFLGEANVLRRALQASRYKITVFLGTVLTVVVTMGALMYLIEGPESGFTSIPQGMYWAIVTMTTVGYGDIAPQTVVGQTIAALLMVFGYGVIAVPTGIVTIELADAARRFSHGACPGCGRQGHDNDAVHCKYCGTSLHLDQA